VLCATVNGCTVTALARLECTFVYPIILLDIVHSARSFPSRVVHGGSGGSYKPRLVERLSARLEKPTDEENGSKKNADVDKSVGKEKRDVYKKADYMQCELDYIQCEGKNTEDKKHSKKC